MLDMVLAGRQSRIQLERVRCQDTNQNSIMYYLITLIVR